MEDVDQLFKKVLRAFFKDVLSLTEPNLLKLALIDEVEFTDKELFTDLAQGEKKFTDLLARLKLSSKTCIKNA